MERAEPSFQLFGPGEVDRSSQLGPIPGPEEGSELGVARSAPEHASTFDR